MNLLEKESKTLANRINELIDSYLGDNEYVILDMSHLSESDFLEGEKLEKESKEESGNFLTIYRFYSNKKTIQTEYIKDLVRVTKWQTVTLSQIEKVEMIKELSERLVDIENVLNVDIKSILNGGDADADKEI